MPQQKKYKFPSIQVAKVKSRYEGVAGLALRSILRGELLMRDDDNRSSKSYFISSASFQQKGKKTSFHENYYSG